MIEVQEYGKALYEIAKEENQIEEVLKEMDTINKLLVENPDYVRLLDTPAIPSDEKIKLLSEAFQGTNGFLLNFIKILCEKHAICDFEKCQDAYRKIYQEEAGIITAIAVTVRPLSAEQTEKLTQKLIQFTGKKIVLENEIDPSLLGGISLRISGKQYDASLKARLESFKKQLSNTIL